MNDPGTHSHCGGCIGDWKGRNKALLRRRAGRKVWPRAAGCGRGTREKRCAPGPRAKTGSQHRTVNVRRPYFKGRDMGMWVWVCVWGLPLLRIPRATKTRIEKLQPALSRGRVARIPTQARARLAAPSFRLSLHCLNR